MAKTHKKPGPHKKYGPRRDYHILLAVEDGLADAFEKQAALHGGVIVYVEQLVRSDLNMPQDT